MQKNNNLPYSSHNPKELISMNLNGLSRFGRHPGTGKKGAPRNEGISTEVYENTDPQKRNRGMSTEVVENPDVKSFFYRS
jgi:hypothetical protein